MTFPRPLISGTLLATLLACARTPSSLTPADISAIKDTYPQWAHAVVTRDLDAAVRLMTTDVRFAIPNQAPIAGRDSVIAWIKTWPRIVGQDWNVEEVGGNGDIAYSRATGIETYQLPGGAPISDHQACLAIHRRQPDGTWRISQAMCLSTEPGPGASQ